MSPTCPQNIVNVGPLKADIGLPLWGGTRKNFNGFLVRYLLLSPVRPSVCLTVVCLSVCNARAPY